MNLHPDWLWINELDETPMAVVLARYGFQSRGDRFWPCPACNEETRSSSDRAKGPATFGDGWHCWRCGEGGRALDLVAWVLLGDSKPAKGDSEGWARLGERLTGHTRKTHSPDEHGQASVRRNLNRPTSRPTNPRPPHRELRRLWGACLPVTEDPAVSAWLAGRGFSPRRIARHDLARALPDDAFCPRWASFMGSRWKYSGHRLIFRAVGPAPAPSRAGWAWSLRARNIQPNIPGHQKSASAACGPGSASGLVYADDHARRMLTGSLPCRLIITEGEPDWLVWASRMADTQDRHRWGVVGVWNGSWSEALAACLSRGATVALRTHRDRAGGDYADRIEATLLPRGVTVFRLVGDGPDENDAMQASRLDIEPLAGCVARQLQGWAG